MGTDTEQGASIDQGTAVVVLEARGHEDAAALLEVAEIEYSSYDAQDGNWNEYEWRAAVTITVDPALLPSYTPEVVNAIHSALKAVTAADSTPMDYPIVVPRAVAREWRHERQRARLDGLTNQAARVPPPPDGFIVRDGLRFRDASEVVVYDMLRSVQAKMRPTDTISFVPNMPVVTPNRVFEVDFFVTYRGRAGVIEIDGASHRGATRYAADSSKNDLLRDAGIEHVLRVPVEDTTDAEALREHLRTFLLRLTGR